MKTKITLSINRAGEFTVPDSAEVPTQCGYTGARHYKYFVSIKANNAVLTKDGFVMDNVLCDEYFQKTYAHENAKCDSCEGMAQAAIEHFLAAFKTNPELLDIQLRSILVRIHGSDFSFIEGEWINPEYQPCK